MVQIPVGQKQATGISVLLILSHIDKTCCDIKSTSASQTGRGNAPTFPISAALAEVGAGLVHGALTDAADGKAGFPVGIKPAGEEHWSDRAQHDHHGGSTQHQTHLPFLEVKALFSFSFRPPLSGKWHNLSLVPFINFFAIIRSGEAEQCHTSSVSGPIFPRVRCDDTTQLFLTCYSEDRQQGQT